MDSQAGPGEPGKSAPLVRHFAAITGPIPARGRAERHVAHLIFGVWLVCVGVRRKRAATVARVVLGGTGFAFIRLRRTAVGGPVIGPASSDIRQPEAGIVGIDDAEILQVLIEAAGTGRPRFQSSRVVAVAPPNTIVRAEPPGVFAIHVQLDGTGDTRCFASDGYVRRDRRSRCVAASITTDASMTCRAHAGEESAIARTTAAADITPKLIPPVYGNA